MKKALFTTILALIVWAGMAQAGKPKTESRKYDFFAFDITVGSDEIGIRPDSAIKISGDTVAIVRFMLLDWQRQYYFRDKVQHENDSLRLELDRLKYLYQHRK